MTVTRKAYTAQLRLKKLLMLTRELIHWEEESRHEIRDEEL
jgi:hypothetical protein